MSRGVKLPARSQHWHDRWNDILNKPFRAGTAPSPGSGLLSAACRCVAAGRGSLTWLFGQVIHYPQSHDQEHTGEFVVLWRSRRIVRVDQEIAVEQRSRHRLLAGIRLHQYVEGHRLTSNRRSASKYRLKLDLPFPTVEAFHVWWPNRPPSRMAHGLVCLAVEMRRSFQAMTFHYLQSRLLRADIRSLQDGRRISQTIDRSSTCLKCYRPQCRRRQENRHFDFVAD